MAWEITGHAWAVDILQQHLARGEQRHAYLFTGPPGVGRRTLALRFAQALNCPEPPRPGELCGSCRVCRQIERMQHADLFAVQRPPGRTRILIDQVRALQHSLSLAPYEAAYRIGLILNFEEANEEAANALLKTLEEPTPRTVLLLTAQTPEALLPTIVSRCEVLRLRPMPLADLESFLVHSKRVDTEKARELAHLSGGRPGYALRLLEDTRLMETQQAWLDDLTRLLAAPLRERFRYAHKVSEYHGRRPEDIEKLRLAYRERLLAWLSLWRDVMLVASGSDTPLANLSREDWTRRVAEHVGLAGARAQVEATEQTLLRLDANINLRLQAEALLMDMPTLPVFG